MHEILKRPLLTEKMTKLQEKSQYGFEVDMKANKIEIARAIEKKFRVVVENVRTMRMKGKTKTQLTRRGRFTGKRSDWKKALVTLREGDKIDFLENV
ncbi:MAG: 50S ribosomal protein L23 [Ignavibacteriales bacterium CG07_land_8_20_14_0_80_59_12]|nr:MAG: 50S ribosomal protein L23 [Ignavibacteriales bacterium CG07_land_8_20_14_0_80_59_12]